MVPNITLRTPIYLSIQALTLQKASLYILLYSSNAASSIKKGVKRKARFLLTVEAPENQIMSERASWSSDSKLGPLT